MSFADSLGSDHLTYLKSSACRGGRIAKMAPLCHNGPVPHAANVAPDGLKEMLQSAENGSYLAATAAQEPVSVHNSYKYNVITSSGLFHRVLVVLALFIVMVGGGGRSRPLLTRRGVEAFTETSRRADLFALLNDAPISPNGGFRSV